LTLFGDTKGDKPKKKKRMSFLFPLKQGTGETILHNLTSLKLEYITTIPNQFHPSDMK
jgi:hypothetical protein